MLSNYNFKGEDYRMKIYKSFDDMRDALKDETGFREYLEQAKWRGTPVCPHCGCISAEHYKFEDQWRIQRSIQMQALPRAFHSHNQDNV
nr:transposase [Barnesiella sp. ET7]